MVKVSVYLCRHTYFRNGLFAVASCHARSSSLLSLPPEGCEWGLSLWGLVAIRCVCFFFVFLLFVVLRLYGSSVALRSSRWGRGGWRFCFSLVCRTCVLSVILLHFRFVSLEAICCDFESSWTSILVLLIVYAISTEACIWHCVLYKIFEFCVCNLWQPYSDLFWVFAFVFCVTSFLKKTCAFYLL